MAMMATKARAGILWLLLAVTPTISASSPAVHATSKRHIPKARTAAAPTATKCALACGTKGYATLAAGLQGAKTVETWVMFDGSTDAASIGTPWFGNTYNAPGLGGESPDKPWGLYLSPTQIYSAQYGGPRWPSFTFGDQVILENKVWHHVAVAGPQLYINGVLMLDGVANYADQVDNMWIGYGPDAYMGMSGNPETNAQGEISFRDFRIWSTIREQADIANSMDSLDTNAPGLLTRLFFQPSAATCQWRATSDCTLNADREPDYDADCDTTDLYTASGFCDCNGDNVWGANEPGQPGVDCAPPTTTCAAACLATESSPTHLRWEVGHAVSNCTAATSACASPSADCPVCPAGTYKRFPGDTGCKLCSPGRFSDTPGSSVCQGCAAGKSTVTSGTADSSSCTACSAGWYSPGGAICVKCLAGKTSTSGTTAPTDCTACPAGQFSISGGACTDCDAGAFAAADGQTACASCSPGQYQSDGGKTACDKCNAGESAPPGSTSRSACSACPAGRWQLPAPQCTSDTMHMVCVDCEAGRYTQSPGMTACVACGPGQTSQANSNACTSCAAGQYFVSADTPCQQCRPGTVSTTPISTTCTRCPQGMRPNDDASACVAKEDGTVHDLRACLQDKFVPQQMTSADETSYSEEKQCFNRRRDIEPWPLMIVQPSDVSEVQKAVQCAAAVGVQICAKGGGWGIENAAGCSNGLQVDLRALKGVTVDAKNNWVRFSAGDRLSEVWTAITQTSDTLVVPFDPSPAGAVGLTLGCGHGILTRLHGTTCQSVYKVEYVDATGTVRVLGGADFVEPAEGLADKGCFLNEGAGNEDPAQDVVSQDDCSALAHSSNKAYFGMIRQDAGWACQLLTNILSLTTAEQTTDCDTGAAGSFMQVYQIVGAPVPDDAPAPADDLDFQGCYADEVPSGARGSFAAYTVARCKDLAASLLLPYFAMADRAACIGLATTPSTREPSCPDAVDGSYQMGSSGIVAAYAVKRIDKVVYKGCYPHSAARQAGKLQGSTMADCAFLAKNDLANYFGMEWPQAFATVGEAHCNLLTVPPVDSAKVADSFCSGETLFGRLLGGYRYMAVYTLQGQIAADDASDEDLLWMAKGGGGEFPGIVTRVYMKAFEVPTSGWLDHTWSCTASNLIDAESVMKRWLSYSSGVPPGCKKFSYMTLNVKPVFQLEVTFFCLGCDDGQASVTQTEFSSVCAVQPRSAEAHRSTGWGLDFSWFPPAAPKANRSAARIGFSWGVSDQFVHDFLLTLAQAPDSPIQVSVVWTPIRGPVTGISASFDTAEWVLHVQHAWDSTESNAYYDLAVTHHLQVSSVLDTYLPCAGHYNYPDKFITCAGGKEERLEALFTDVQKMRQVKDTADPHNVFRSMLRQATAPQATTRARKGGSKSRTDVQVKASLGTATGIQRNGISLAGALAASVAIVTLCILAAISCRWAVGRAQKYDHVPVPMAQEAGQPLTE